MLIFLVYFWMTKRSWANCCNDGRYGMQEDFSTDRWLYLVDLPAIRFLSIFNLP